MFINTEHFCWPVKSIKYVLEEDGLRSRVHNYILKTFRSVWIILTKEDDCHVDSCCFKKWWVFLSMFLIFWGPRARCRRCPQLWSAFFLCRRAPWVSQKNPCLKLRRWGVASPTCAAMRITENLTTKKSWLQQPFQQSHETHAGFGEILMDFFWILWFSNISSGVWDLEINPKTPGGPKPQTAGWGSVGLPRGVSKAGHAG